MRLTVGEGTPPWAVAPGHPALRAAARAYAAGFGRAPVLLRSGGTIPVVTLFERELGLQTVLMGFGLPDDRKHGPDEFLYLPNFWRGIRTSLAFMREVARSLRCGPPSQRPRRSPQPLLRPTQATHTT